jgi:hypothetical protein
MRYVHISVRLFHYSQLNRLCIIKEEDNFECRFGKDVEGSFHALLPNNVVREEENGEEPIRIARTWPIN